MRTLTVDMLKPRKSHMPTITMGVSARVSE